MTRDDFATTLRPIEVFGIQVMPKLTPVRVVHGKEDAGWNQGCYLVETLDGARRACATEHDLRRSFESVLRDIRLRSMFPLLRPRARQTQR